MLLRLNSLVTVTMLLLLMMRGSRMIAMILKVLYLMGTILMLWVVMLGMMVGWRMMHYGRTALMMVVGIIITLATVYPKGVI